jgi:hypothetical protein
MADDILPFPDPRPHAAISRAELDSLYRDLLVADAVLDVLSRALESVNDDQGAVERMTVETVRERIMGVAAALDRASLSAARTSPEAA